MDEPAATMVNNAASDIYRLFGFEGGDDEQFNGSADPLKAACWQAALSVFEEALNHRLELLGDDGEIPLGDYLRCLNEIYRH